MKWDRHPETWSDCVLIMLHVDGSGNNLIWGHDQDRVPEKQLVVLVVPHSCSEDTNNFIPCSPIIHSWWFCHLHQGPASQSRPNREFEDDRQAREEEKRYWSRILMMGLIYWNQNFIPAGFVWWQPLIIYIGSHSASWVMILILITRKREKISVLLLLLPVYICLKRSTDSTDRIERLPGWEPETYGGQFWLDRSRLGCLWYGAQVSSRMIQLSSKLFAGGVTRERQRFIQHTECNQCRRCSFII